MKKTNILAIVILTLFPFVIIFVNAKRSQRFRGVFSELLSSENVQNGFLSADSVYWFDFPISEQLDEGGVPGGILDVTHPSVVYLSSSFPQIRHNLWVALTPYPESIGGECYENTCIYGGFYDENIGINPSFSNIHQNPILFRDYAGFNSDPDLFYDEQDSLLYCITRKQNCPDSQNVFVLQHSNNGEDWSVPLPIFKTDKLSLCPCLLKVNGKYYIYVFTPDDYYSIHSTYDVWESSSLSDPDFKLIATHEWPHNSIGIWHGDIIFHKNNYYMCFCGFNKNYSNRVLGGMEHSRYLWIARSCNGVDWQFYDKPLLKKSGLYRSSIFVDLQDKLVCTFSVHHREFSEKYPSGNRIGSIRLSMSTIDSLINSVIVTKP